MNDKRNNLKPGSGNYPALHFSVPVLATLLLAWAAPVLASSDGNFSTANFTGQTPGMDCTLCHTQSANFEPDVMLTGPTLVAINTSAEFVLQITENGSPFPERGGFQIAVSDGELDPGDATVQELSTSNRLSHNNAKDFTGDASTVSVTWPIQFMATTAGNYTFYWCGNAANGMAGSNGDSIACGTREIVVCDNCDDDDNDGVLNDQDNCTVVFNPSQCDSDSDGFGNHCDGDLDNSGGIANFGDLAVFRTQFGAASDEPIYDVADFDCSGGLVNFEDLSSFGQLFGTAPGPAAGGD